ncbi:MAG: response regulator [Thermodesulfobacteriota bacterium]|nr:response regulator [Thermodesulfobacteriota bacterium]
MARILLVDDEEDVLATLRVLIKSEGHKVIAIREGLEALELIRSSEKFDLLVTDLRMAPVDGMELIEMARTERPEMGIVVISAYLDDDTTRKVESLGCRLHIKKPFIIDEVVNAIHDELIRTGVGLALDD